MDTSDLPILCPPGDSRTERELIVKLIVAHVTAVVAFCNFLSVRNERLDTIEPVLFLLSPFIVVFQTFLGLLAINFLFVIHVVTIPRSFYDHVDAYARQWNMLFGRKLESNSSGIKRTPTGTLESQRTTTRSKLGKARIRLGNSAATFGTLFQCVSTIFLYKRRYESYGWDSLTIVDHRAFELAVGGAFVSVLGLALLLRLPGFGYAPETEYTSDALTDFIILFSRGDTRRCPRWYQILYFSDLGHHSSAFTFFLCVASATYKGQVLSLGTLGTIYAGIYEISMEQFSLDMSITRFYIYVGVFFVVAFAIARLYFFISDRGNCSPMVMVPFALAICCVAIAIYCVWMIMLCPLLVISFLPVISGPTCAFTIKGYDAKHMFLQPPFVPPSNETECLALWKDPVAEYLWSLV
ncbi:hypothetical protein FSARC_340 [Fusarium sarcochroum]|uniref:Transmembrane protein n=1 Tax=Fusarium sarcochroum TaxID=1208366 RepID=A0A8H4UC45_9HYPO|nr:hypothetical protein FSARC_340 [Fusarium sarcochroum]